MSLILSCLNRQEPFMAERQGYHHNYDSGTPVGHRTELIPFVSDTFDVTPDATYEHYLMSTCGELYNIVPDIITKGDMFVVTWANHKHSALLLYEGFYYFQSWITPPIAPSAPLPLRYILFTSDYFRIKGFKVW